MESIAATTFVIFGVTGDLARRKLFPALFDLASRRALPTRYKIIGFSRRPLSDEEFKALIAESVAGKNPEAVMLQEFLARTEYVRGNFDELASYQNLAERLAASDQKEFGVCSNKLFYLSVPPSLYEGIFRELAASGLTIPCGGDEGWTRVLVEKPFGRDSRTAKKLDALLGELFQETQIFRIDHYLAKETLQNILTFRFSNTLFEPLWSAEHIESVTIRLLEKIDLQGRGAFYDDVGTVRDVGQNHLLQMLALVAMERPEQADPESIRHERAKIFKKLVPIEDADMSARVIRGQYAGFREEKGVKPDSQTETYFKITAEIDSMRWKGVPFILESGKALAETKADIVVRFKSAAQFGTGESQPAVANEITFRIQPDEGISIQFSAKAPGLAFAVEPERLSFKYKREESAARIPDAYEKVLYDCVRGDQTLFTSTEEVKATWKFMTPIIESLDRVPLHVYEKGSAPDNVSKNA